MTSRMEREASLSDRYERPQDFPDDAPCCQGGCGRTSRDVESSGALAFYSAVGVVLFVAVALIYHWSKS